MPTVLALLGVTAHAPASAEPAALAFTGTLWIACFGCDVPAPARAELSMSGSHNGAAHAELTIFEASGTLCAVTGHAFGTVSGSVNFNIVWTRDGPVAWVVMSGRTTGTGYMTIVPVDPPAFQCGAPMVAAVAGVLAGV